MSYTLAKEIENSLHPLFRRLAYIVWQDGGDMGYTYYSETSNMAVFLKSHVRDFVLMSRLSGFNLEESFALTFREIRDTVSVFGYKGISSSSKDAMKSEFEKFISRISDVDLEFHLVDYCPQWITDNFYKE